MGCISSKDVLTQSMSIREEYLKPHGFQSTTVVAWEDLLTSHGANHDQLLALVRSASSKMKNKLNTATKNKSSSSSSSNLIKDTKGKTEAVQEIPNDVENPSFRRFSRSKSFQVLAEAESLVGASENKLGWSDKNLAGSRSFHTVEEYDALLERIHKSTRSSRASFESYGMSCMEKEVGTEEELVLERDVNGQETGAKRKAMAKGLKSLDVSPIEFPSIGTRLRQWNQVEGQVFSPGTYVTPKFGSYNSNGRPLGIRGSSCVFSPELVTAFEDCMLQLQEEEESILRLMEGYLAVDEMEIDQVEDSDSKLS